MRNGVSVSPVLTMRRGVWGVLVGLFLVVQPAQAFVLGQTRAIMSEGAPASVTVISGAKDGVLLIQARTSRDKEGGVRAPELLVSPPVFRLEKGGRAMLRLSMLPVGDLPRDRESVRYLAVTGIPSSNPLSPDRGKVASGIVVGQGAIIKVFFRPRGLSSTSDATWKALQATRVPGGVELYNPTPFHMTLNNVWVDQKKATMTNNNTGMLAPFSRQLLGTKSVGKKEVEWRMTNDLGAQVTGKTAIH